MVKAKLFGKIEVEFQENPMDKKELVLSKPISIQPRDFIGNLKVKLPKSIDKLLNKELTINKLYWIKSDKTTIEIPINPPNLFTKVEKYLQLEAISIVIKTDEKILK